MIKSILVVEDDKAVRNLITTSLAMFGYKHSWASTGAGAIMEAVSARPDLFIMDLGLPDMDGTDIIIKLRTWTMNPIIVVSARSETQDIITALDAGADDYLIKPFSVEELMARIRVSLRRTIYDENNSTESHVFDNGGLHIDYASTCVFLDNVEIHLTPLEYKLLCLLAHNIGKVLTHNYIVKTIWSSDLESDTQSLRVYMASLRKKIEKIPSEPIYLQTHAGIGYRMIRLKDINVET